MNANTYSHVSQLIGSAVACGAGLADLWHFHALPVEVACGLVVAGLVGFGLKAAGLPAPRPLPS